MTIRWTAEPVRLSEPLDPRVRGDAPSAPRSAGSPTLSAVSSDVEPERRLLVMAAPPKRPDEMSDDERRDWARSIVEQMGLARQS